jgi:hypothetical protein
MKRLLQVAALSVALLVPSFSNAADSSDVAAMRAEIAQLKALIAQMQTAQQPASVGPTTAQLIAQTQAAAAQQAQQGSSQGCNRRR